MYRCVGGTVLVRCTLVRKGTYRILSTELFFYCHDKCMRAALWRYPSLKMQGDVALTASQVALYAPGVYAETRDIRCSCLRTICDSL